MNSTELFIDFQDDLFSKGSSEQAKNHAYICDLGDAALKDFGSCFDASDSKWQNFIASGDLWSLQNHDSLPTTEEREMYLDRIVSEEFNQVSAESADFEDLESRLPALRERLEEIMGRMWAQYEDNEEPTIAKQLHEMARSAADSA